MNIRVKVYGLIILVLVALGAWYLASKYYPRGGRCQGRLRGRWQHG